MKEEIRAKIEEHHKEEMADHDAYLAMAVELEKDGQSHLAGVLRDIAHDEHTHAVALSHVLEKGARHDSM